MWKRGNPWSLALLMAEGSRLDLSPCQVGRIHVRSIPKFFYVARVCSTARDSVLPRTPFRRVSGFVRSRGDQLVFQKRSCVLGKLLLCLHVFFDERRHEFAVHLLRKLGRSSRVTHLESRKFVRMPWSLYKFNLNVSSHFVDWIAGIQQGTKAVSLWIKMKSIDDGLKASPAENLLRYGLQTVLDAGADVRNNVQVWNILLFQQNECF